MSQRIALPVFVLALILFSGNALGLYNDVGNDSCLTIYSDQQTYHTSTTNRFVSAELFFENKCEKEIIVDFGLLSDKQNSFFFKKAESFSTGKWQALSLKEKNVSPTTGASVPVKGWEQLVVPIEGARIKVSFDSLVSRGEFVIFAKSIDDERIFSILDPWFEDGEIVADQYTRALYHLNANAGLTAIDSNASCGGSGCFPLTLVTGTWDAVDKKYGVSSIDFAGTDYATSGNLLDLNAAAITISMWIKPNAQIDNLSGRQHIATKYNTATDQFMWYFVNLDGRLRFALESSEARVIDMYSTTATWSAGAWYHVMVKYGSGGAKMYVNGVLEDSDAQEWGMMNGTSDSFFLGSSGEGGWKFNGNIDEVEVATTNRNVNNPGTAAPSAFNTSIEMVDDYSAYTGFPTFSYFLDGNLTIDFNVQNSDNNRLYVDINYGTTPWVGGGTVIVKDLNIVSSMCLDGNNNWGARPATCSWDWNISSVPDENYYIVLNVKNWNYPDSNASDATDYSLSIDNLPDLTVTFYDENHYNTKLLHITTTFNGETKTVDTTDGNVIFSLEGKMPGVYTLSAWQDGNYSTRYFDVNYTGTSIAMKPRLLRDVNGISIPFKFYGTDDITPLVSPFITVYRGWNDWNIVEQRLANSSGETSFFLHPDTNYVFAVKNNGVTTNYPSATLTIAIPKNESLLTQVTPFDARVGNIASRAYLTQNASVTTFPVFSNTKNVYAIDINASGYYPRKNEVIIKGNQETYTIQPYLAATLESAEYIFYVMDSLTTSSIPGVQIDVTRMIPGEGTVVITKIITDSAGTAAISLLLGVEYDFKYYYGGIDVTPTSSTIRATSAGIYYTVYLPVTTTTVLPKEVGSLTVSCEPNQSSLYLNSAGQMDFNVLIDFSGKDFNSMWVTIQDSNWGCNGTTVPCDKNYYSAAYTRIHKLLDGNTFQTQYSLMVIVDLNSTDGNTYRGTCSFTVVAIGEWDLSRRLALLATELNGPNGKNTTSFIAILLTLCAIGALAFGGVHEPFLLGVMACIFLGLFLVFGWIELMPFLFVTMFFIIVAMLSGVVM